MTNARVAGFEVDAVWPDRRLIVEVDGYAFHGHIALLAAALARS